MKFTRRKFMAAATLAAAAPALPHAIGVARAAAPQVGKQAPAFYRFKLGDFEVTTLQDGVAKIPKPEAFVVNKPLEEINKALDAAFIPRDNVRIPFTPTLVNTGKNLVLIDTGFGDNGGPTTGQLMTNLAAAGVDPKSIDTILITHFHPDHLSGIRAKAGAANFPNAEIIVAANEYKFWTDEGEESRAAAVWKASFANTKRTLGPIAKDVKRIDYGKEAVPGITLIDSRGHSPGHASYVVASGNAKLMVIGDVTNLPGLFARNPDFRLWADMIPDQALDTRRKLLDMVVAEKMPITGYHYPFPAHGYFTKQGAGYEFAPATWSPTL
ncbi:MAG: MBL fold metallo-hydrolase [Proteobacteria bacterium]|nr:MBL fold metallo-hydrolase [Pseudomonadota bacterium]